ncbi:MAG: hypothetical protein COV34_01415 [Candidatus Zambryskibacteria bacterium CG10_big_fil_rev_8_21_14_0_10_42_12]|uniref:Serine protease n=1 Tax=Candidatus Zambryskibacteria bacterium CG10_big_fil_rev_8_21_14_0_10_42_12 TaxID=1975115 RepID=A0A2H0QVF6_9BACT|nr:MAG: hypothetical protein COV34_01415 [Candidatus Zambryskibacteria bacterium CG10_big_fil_rev_8_21_14_0_10_42_12]
MEELNQHQLILLVLLVSFVTSIGTGIITVSLLQEAPPVVTSTVNRVVEKTIETVVQGPSENNGNNNTETVREVTVVVNQEDLVTESIAQNSKSLVRIYETRPLGSERFYGVGIMVPGGVISGISSPYDGSANYRIEYPDGTETLVTRVQNTAEEQLAAFKITDDTTHAPVTFGNSAALKLGQTLITIGGESQNVISIGTLSSLVTDASGVPTRLDLSIDEKDSIAGAPVITLQGNIVGIRTRETLADGTVRVRYIPAHVIQSTIAKISS